jgi:hypothetical protein
MIACHLPLSASWNFAGSSGAVGNASNPVCSNRLFAGALRPPLAARVRQLPARLYPVFVIMSASSLSSGGAARAVVIPRSGATRDLDGLPRRDFSPRTRPGLGMTLPGCARSRTG